MESSTKKLWFINNTENEKNSNIKNEIKTEKKTKFKLEYDFDNILQKKSKNKKNNFPFQKRTFTQMLTNANTNEKNQEKKNFIQEINKILDSKKQTEKLLKKEEILFNLIDNFLNKDENLFLIDDCINSINYYDSEENKISNYIIKRIINYHNDILMNFNKNDKNLFSFIEIFTPLNLIYFIKKNEIFLWDFNLNILTKFKEIKETIFNIHITIPKKNFFNNKINFILLIATLKKIYLCVLIRDENNQIQIKITDHIFETNSKITTSITSTKNYRIFIGGKDNNINELEYSNKQNFLFFNKRKSLILNRDSQSFFDKIFSFNFIYPKNNYFHKLTIDNTRNILYALKHISETDEIYNLDKIYDSSIFIYDLGTNGKIFKKIGEIDQETIINSIKINQFYNQINIEPIKKNFVIIDVIPIKRNESKFNQLMIITKNGFRVYFKFDTFFDRTKFENEEKIIEFDNNYFFRNRILPRFFPSNRPLPQIIKNNVNNNYENIFYVDGKIFVCFEDSFDNKKYLNVIENDLSKYAKNENFFIYEKQNNSEIINNIFDFNLNEKIIKITKIFEYSEMKEINLFNLLKDSENDNLFYPNINFFGDDGHLTYNSMHEYAKQLFSNPEGFFIILDTKIIEIIKLRPIDQLFDIIINFNKDENQINYDLSTLNSNNNNSNFNTFYNENYKNRFEIFVEKNGFIETCCMLFSIISDKTLVFYKKKIITRNFNNEIDFDERFTVEEIKNNFNIIQQAEIFLNIMLKITEKKINFYYNEKVKENQIEQNKNNNNNNNNNNNYNNNNNNYNNNNNETDENNLKTIFKEENKITNFISYSLFLYISRIVRLFWEEKLYIKHQIDINDFDNFYLTDSLFLQQISFIKSLLISLGLTIKSKKEDLIQKTSNLNNLFNRIQIEIKKSEFFKKNNQNIFNILNQNEQDDFNLKEINNLFDFKNISHDFDNLIKIIDKLIEILNFANIIYTNIEFKHQIERNKITEFYNLKFKDIFYNSNSFILQNILEEIFEIIIEKNDIESINNILSEMNKNCPSIISKNHIEIIRASLLIKLSNKINKDEVTKTNDIKRAIQILIKNPGNIKLNQIIRSLNKIGDLISIVQLSVNRAIFLKTFLNENYINNKEEDEKIQKEIENCYFYVVNNFKILLDVIENKNYNIINNINNNNNNIKKNEEEKENNFLMRINLEKKTIEELINIKKTILEYIFSVNDLNLHNIIFDFLKNKNLSNELYQIKSEFVENYFNNKVKEEQFVKTNEDLFKFYLSINDLEQAKKILINLVNFDINKMDSIIIENDNYSNLITLEKRINYSNILLGIIDKQINNNNNFQEKENLLKLKKELKKNIEILNFQNEIYDYLNHSKIEIEYELEKETENENKKINLNNQLNSNRDALIKLNLNLYSLKELYEIFGKNFNLFQIIFKIIFYSKQKNINFIQNEEIIENYDNFFYSISNENEKEKFWPEFYIRIFDDIFIYNFLFSDNKNLNYYSIIKQNNFNENKNSFKNLIPIYKIIYNIEKLNFEIIFNKIEKEDFKFKSNQNNYFSNKNIFWFFIYLKEKITLPCSYIYDLYKNVNENNQNENFNIYFKFSIINIINHWLKEIDFFITIIKRNKGNKNNYLYSQTVFDYENFLKKKEFLKYDFDEIENLIRENIQFSNDKKESLIYFIKFVYNNYLDLCNKLNNFHFVENFDLNLLNDKSSVNYYK